MAVSDCGLDVAPTFLFHLILQSSFEGNFDIVSRVRMHKWFRVLMRPFALYFLLSGVSLWVLAPFPQAFAHFS